MAVGDAHVFPGFLTPVLTQISFQATNYFSHMFLKEVSGENMPERNFASTESQTHSHQVMIPTEPTRQGQEVLLWSSSQIKLSFHVLTLSQTTNFRLFQTERVCRQQFQIWWKLNKVLQMGSNFCFSHSVFKGLVLQTCKNKGLFGKGLSFLVNIYIGCVTIFTGH